MQCKRLVTMVGLLTLASFVPSWRTIHAQSFTDVQRGHWAYDAVEKSARLGLVLGPGDGSFRGEDPPTRYEMAMGMAKVLAEVDNRINVRGVPDSLIANLEQVNLTFARQIDALNKDVGALKDGLRALYRKEGMAAPF